MYLSRKWIVLSTVATIMVIITVILSVFFRIAGVLSWVALLAALVIFIYSGIKMRCPFCGTEIEIR